MKMQKDEDANGDENAKGLNSLYFIFMGFDLLLFSIIFAPTLHFFHTHYQIA